MFILTDKCPTLCAIFQWTATPSSCEVLTLSANRRDISPRSSSTQLIIKSTSNLAPIYPKKLLGSLQVLENSRDLEKICSAPVCQTRIPVLRQLHVPTRQLLTFTRDRHLLVKNVADAAFLEALGEPWSRINTPANNRSSRRSQPLILHEAKPLTLLPSTN